MATYENEYVHGSRRDKTIVSAKVVATIKDIGKMEGGGRFLKLNSKTKKWEEIPDSVARQRVGHSIRDTLRRKAFMAQNGGKDPSKKQTRKYTKKKKNPKSAMKDRDRALKDRLRTSGILSRIAPPAGQKTDAGPLKKRLKPSNDDSSSSEEEGELANALLSLKRKGDEESSSSPSSKKKKTKDTVAAPAPPVVPQAPAGQNSDPSGLYITNHLTPDQRNMLVREHLMLQDAQARNALAASLAMGGIPHAAFMNNPQLAAVRAQMVGGMTFPGMFNTPRFEGLTMEQARLVFDMQQQARLLSIPTQTTAAGAANAEAAAPKNSSVGPKNPQGLNAQQQQSQQNIIGQVVDYRNLAPHGVRNNPGMFVTFTGAGLGGGLQQQQQQQQQQRAQPAQEQK